MKWAFLVILIAIAPALAAWLKTNPRRAPVAWAMLTFLPFVLTPWHLFIAPYSTALWPGFVKGWEVSLLDAVAIGILLGTRTRWRGMVLIVPFVLYIVAVLFAVSQARFGLIALAYPIQLVRVFLVFLAAAKVAQSERGERALVTGLVLGLTVQALYALSARAGGALQTGGSLGHQNLLGFVSHMALLPAFALFLGRRFSKMALLGIFSGLIVVALTASRATILIAGSGLALVLLFSLALRFKGRKAAVAMASLVVFGLGSVVAAQSLERRFAEQGQMSLLEEDSQRIAFAKAAWAMIEAKPLGVGPNHYVFIANTEGYSARAGVSWTAANRGAHVHNAFLVVWSETGWLGLFTLLILLGASLRYAFGTAIRYRREPEADLLIGLGVAYIAIITHSFVEWMLVDYPAQYVFGGTLGLVAGLRMRLRARGTAAARSGAATPAAERQLAFAS